MKSLFEEMGGTYHWEGDYLIPDLGLPEQEDYQLGKYGRMHQAYLKEHHPVRYSLPADAGPALEPSGGD